MDEHFDEEIVGRREQPFLKLFGDKEEDIVLIFSGESARYIEEYEAGRAKHIEHKANGLYFYQTASVTDDVVRWVRSYGTEIEVVKPVWLKEKLVEEAKERLQKG